MKTVVIIGSPILHKNYQAALEKASCSAFIFPDASCLKERPDTFDGLLLPGGGDVLSSLSDYAPFTRTPPAPGKEPDVYVTSPYDISLDLEQLHALHLFYEKKKPVLGICKGMQLINLYFHGTIRDVSNPNLHKDPKQDVFHLADNQPGTFLSALFGPRMLINSCHHQCIRTPGRDLQIIQYAMDREAEAIAHLHAPVLGTQWHPERMPKTHRQDAILLFRYFVSLL